VSKPVGVVLDASAALSWILDDTDHDHIARINDLLRHLDIRTDVVGNQVLRLSKEALAHGLTSYDVTYLLLARDRGLPLATLDRNLARAAKVQGVTLAM